MVKISVKIDKRYRLANGKYTVKISIARNGKTFYVPLNIEIGEKDWNASAKNMDYIINVANRRSLNLVIRAEYARVEQAIRDLQLSGKLRSITNKELQTFLSYDRKTTDSDKELFLKQAKQYISQCKTDGTRSAYETALKALQRHFDLEKLSLTDITKQMLVEFKSKLQKEELKVNTIENYIAHIRSIYNYAYHNGIINTPFPYILSHKEQTAKRSLLAEQIKLMISGNVSAIQRKYIDVFTLILFMRGINMKDLSELPSDAIHNGRIIYRRHKTGKEYEIKVEPEIKEIIDRYKGKKQLLRFFDNKKGDYYKNFGNAMRQTLRNASKSLGITEHISAYWARHSWATIAIEIGGTMELVSAGLGHSFGAPVTTVYVAYRQKQIDELSRRVIDYILDKGEYSK